MHVTLQQVSKRFGAQIVLSEVNLSLTPGSVTGIIGPNGSGKSTLLQVIAGALKPDTGSATYELNGAVFEPDEVFQYVSIAAPYLKLYEDLSLSMALDTHVGFKPLQAHITVDSFFDIVMLSNARNKNIRDLSSGMLQRFKLGLALLCDAPLLLIDEPGSNLDAAGITWYQELLSEYRKDRTTLICSNREQEELKSCDRVLVVTEL